MKVKYDAGCIECFVMLLWKFRYCFCKAAAVFYWVITRDDGSHGGKVFSTIYLSVCLFFCTVSQNMMQLGSPNVTYKCSTSVWTAVHRCTCRTAAFRPPVLTLGGTCIPPTVNYLQYLATASTFTAVGPFQLPAPQSRTHSRISSGTRP